MRWQDFSQTKLRPLFMSTAYMFKTTDKCLVHSWLQTRRQVERVCVFYKNLKAQARKLHGWRAIVGWFEVLLQATAYGKTKTEETKR